MSDTIEAPITEAPAPAETPAPTRLAAKIAPPAEAPASPEPLTAPDSIQAPPQPFPLIDGDLNFRAGWGNDLGPEYQQYAKSAAKFDNLPSLMKSYGELEKLRTVPGADANPEAVELYRKSNNIPSDPKTFAEALTLPDGIALPESVLSKAIEVGLSQNLTPSQMSAMIAFESEAGQAAAEEMKAAEEARIDAEFDELEKGWGGDAKIHYGNAQSAAEMLGLDFNNPNIGNNATLVSALAKLSERLDEDTLRNLNPGGGTVHGEGGQGWAAKASSIAKDPSNPLYTAYHDPNHPEHDAANRKYDQYAAQASGFHEG